MAGKENFYALIKEKNEWSNKSEKNPADFDAKFHLFLDTKAKEFRNDGIKERWFSIPDVPALERAATGHKHGPETNLPAVIRTDFLPLENYILQTGRTCALTSFRMILRALGKQVPTYEELMGKPWYDIEGSLAERDHRRYLNKAGDCADIKETRVVINCAYADKDSALTEAIFKLLSEGNYLYVSVNWQRLHGQPSSNGESYLDHGIVLNGARETEKPVQENRFNFLITDPNHPRYHNIWVPKDLLFKSMLDEVKIYGYRVSRPKLSERIIRSVKRSRPVARFEAE